ncbi:MAG: HAD family hydrolase [Phycisphaerae bacterium]|nr:HAD family hydrolase [Phycisphaerae bacterium]
MSLLYRLLAIDLDGTLLNSRNQLSSGNREALHRAHEAGLIVSLCTGRNLAESRAVIEQIGLDLNAGIFAFGAIVADLAAGKTISRTAMSPELASRLISHLSGQGFPMLVLYDAAEMGYDYYFVEGQHNRAAYEQWLSFTPSRTERRSSWTPQAHAPLRVSVIVEPDRIKQTMADLRAKFDSTQTKINSIYAPNYQLHVVECFAPNVNKWFGISQLAAQLGIAHEQTAAIGDDVNDVEMISSAGLGVAMGNAIPAVVQVSQLQAPTNDQDGVAWLINRILDQP